MFLVLKIIGVLTVLYFAAAFILIQKRRPKFFKGRLKPLERKLFDELKAALPVEAQQLLTAQLQKPLRGCRSYFEKHFKLELYIKRKDVAFPRKGAYDIGSVTFNYEGGKYVAKFPTSVGLAWGMDIRPSAKKFLNKSNIEVVKVKVLNNPMVEIDLRVVREFYSEAEELPEPLKALNSTYQLTKVSRPLSEEQRVLFIKENAAKFPGDFLELTKATDGFNIGEIEVHGLSGLESIPLEDGEYLKIIEAPKGVLTIKQTKRVTKLLYFSFDDPSEGQDMGPSFMEALKRMTQH